jgi:hypothetical protein
MTRQKRSLYDIRPLGQTLRRSNPGGVAWPPKPDAARLRVQFFKIDHIWRHGGQSDWTVHTDAAGSKTLTKRRCAERE